MDTGTAAVTRSTSTASPRRRSGAELAIDAIAGLLIAGLAVVPPVDVQEASLLVAALAFAAIIVRSVLPGTALVLAWAMALAQWQLGERPGFADVALLLVLYSTARRGSRPTAVLGAASALVGGSVATVYLLQTGARFSVLTQPGGPGGVIFAAAPVLALLLAWLTGLVVRVIRSRTAESRLRVQAEDTAVKAVDLAQAETLRASMARDVHDIVGHSLAVIIAQADSVQFLDDEERIRGVSATIADTARRSLAEVREVLSGTSTAEADDGPEDLDAVVAQVRAAGVDLAHEVRGARRAVDPARQVVIRRVAQEMTTNAMRHGEPGGRIRLRETWRTADVVLEVENPVALRGPAPDHVDPLGLGALRVGTGVEGMRARLAAVGGDLEAEPVDDLFTARARIPLPAAHPIPTVPGGRP
ncbi:sensor histidine kinase [Clavibacter michiganensis]|uniref:sensor histidine kinase n=1 Tax=Clavibacter michiganensis TaxID=28447 RepID=UPI0009A8ED0D|nr:histidine kinase [Clavibacter michiganensis]MBE3077771.1 two-component sensor histidine kinase [Clavibacter michiganensis subsp. michiganensis]MBF4638866.1 two-component sensor histidine kinase [Clavibacter michiganensis subsp. michiganensis]MDO4018775.1 histidine kinase [Clavibacter michiganensis]MDO4025890.1 histidine kinase [Clavibacter michiganensis]MDO4038568.1 histidine kinase [Clavibacter michiganensis]